MSVIEEIAAERQRQIDQEGWTPEHDDEHADGEMAKAAGVYALSAGYYNGPPNRIMQMWWPWDRHWWKTAGGPRRMLIKAAALIVAETERLDRVK